MGFQSVDHRKRMPKARTAGQAPCPRTHSRSRKSATRARAKAPVTALKAAAPPDSARRSRRAHDTLATPHLEAGAAGDHVERLLGDLARVVRGALEVARHEDVVGARRHGARVLHHEGDALAEDLQ